MRGGRLHGARKDKRSAHRPVFPAPAEEELAETSDGILVPVREDYGVYPSYLVFAEQPGCLYMIGR